MVKNKKIFFILGMILLVVNGIFSLQGSAPEDTEQGSCAFTWFDGTCTGDNWYCCGDDTTTDNFYNFSFNAVSERTELCSLDGNFDGLYEAVGATEGAIRTGDRLSGNQLMWAITYYQPSEINI